MYKMELTTPGAEINTIGCVFGVSSQRILKLEKNQKKCKNEKNGSSLIAEYTIDPIYMG